MSNTKLNREDYLEAVRKYGTTTNNVIATKLGVHRANVGKFLKRNEGLLEEAKQMLAGKDKIAFNQKAVTNIDVFSNIPIIAEWEELLIRKDMKADGVRSHKFAIMRVANATGVHPTQFELDMIADKVYEWKIAKENKLPYPRGCSYNTVRSALRSFFSLMHGIPSEQLTMKGIGAEHTEGFAKASKEKLDLTDRKNLVKNLRIAIKEVFEEQKIDTAIYPIDDYWLEMLGIMVWMYYTATRIDSSTDAYFNNPKSSYKTGEYIIQVTDKGRGSRLDWDKRLIANGYDVFSKYIEERFSIPVDKQEMLLPKFESLIFPLLSDKTNSSNYGLECAVMKRVQEISNCYKIPQINHLWRHTFAQDWLEAMEGNYEVGAEVGGWKDIGTMKRCYGAVSDRIIKRGLRRAMGLPVEEEVHELRFLSSEDDEWLDMMIETRGFY